MTLEQKKEQLSNGFIGILAANKGFMIDKPSQDYGVDYQIKKTTSRRTPNGKDRLFTDCRYIDLQLKSTTENSIIDDASHIKYNLEAKSYNDLVDRQNDGIIPLVLILFILPNDYNNWVEIDLDEIKLRKHAFWYVPPSGSVQTSNTSSIVIHIPKSNILDLDCFNNLHQRFYPSTI